MKCYTCTKNILNNLIFEFIKYGMVTPRFSNGELNISYNLSKVQATIYFL